MEKMYAAVRGVPKSAEHRAKLSAAKRGKPLSSEHKAKLSASLKGKTRRPLSKEVRARMSVERKGKGGDRKRTFWASLTPEQRSAIARKGHRTRTMKLTSHESD
jgi:plasmid stability protein